MATHTCSVQVYAASPLASANASRAEALVAASRAAHPQPLTVTGTYAADTWTQVG